MLAEPALRGSHLLQPLRSDPGSVREPRRETRARRTIPGAESERPAGLTDVAFGQLRLDERMADAVLGGRRQPRPMINGVGEVSPLQAVCHVLACGSGG